jgi:general secretion pathway protein E
MVVKKIGKILVENTPLTQEKLDEALEIQAKEKKPLGEILVDRGYLLADDLLKALSIQLGLGYIDKLPTIDEIDPEIVNKVSISYVKEHDAVPLYDKDDCIYIATSKPLNLELLNSLSVLYGKKTKFLVANSTKIQDLINKLYERRSEADISKGMGGEEIEDLAYELEEPTDLLDVTDEAPIIKLVHYLIFRAAKERASDIHIEPYDKELVIRFRLDGVLYDLYHYPKKFHNSIVTRVKVMAELDIAEKRLPQDGRIRKRIANKDIDIRVSILPTSFGERVVMRLLDKTSVLLELPDLGFSGKNLEYVYSILAKKHGIFLVTGPTGSGKSTTLYAALTRINDIALNIMTIEDPVEYQIRGIAQMQVNPKIDLTFAMGLRAILRQDPDVIMIGEIRDTETAEIAIQASLTGHLVLSTLHTNDAPSAISRLLDMDIEPFLVSSSVLAVLAQRLVRQLCSHCKEEYKLDKAHLKELGIEAKQFEGKPIYKAVGCPKCLKKGYLGRTVIHELMPITDDIRLSITQGKDAAHIRKVATKEGMITMREDGLSKVLEGITSIDEVLRVTQLDVD